MLSSPVSGTSPSSPVNSNSVLPLIQPPPASSAASSPSAPLSPPPGSSSSSGVVVQPPPLPMVLVMPSGGHGGNGSLGGHHHHHGGGIVVGDGDSTSGAAAGTSGGNGDGNSGTRRSSLSLSLGAAPGDNNHTNNSHNSTTHITLTMGGGGNDGLNDVLRLGRSLPSPPDPPPPSSSSPYSGAGGSGSDAENAEQVTTPLLSRFDPYHGTTCFVHHPFTQQPLSGEEMRESLQRALCYGATQMSERLNHHDLSPSVFGMEDGSLRSAESFRDLLERGNQWLRQNPQYSVRNAESVTWWTTEQIHVGDTEAVLLEQAPSATQPAGDTIFLTGLRLWVVQRDEDAASVQQLRVRDFHPTEQESLSNLVRRVNSQLEEAPCPGTILTIETVPYADVSSRDSDLTLWRESQCKQGIHTLFLRIFYIEGQTKQETIGIRDFCPELNSNGSDSFGNLVKSAKRWVNEEKYLRLINLRSVYVTQENDSPEESADRTTQRYFQFDIHHYFTVLRVFFVRRARSGCSNASTSSSSASSTSGVPYRLINYVTFTPVQLLPGESTEVEYEKMRQTMVRVCAWIKASGARILSCESVITPLYAQLPTQTLPEITHWEPTSADGQLSSNNVKKYLLHVRLYLEGEYQEPDPLTLPPLPSSLTAALQATLLDRERRHYRRKKKRRKRRRNIMIVLSAIILSVIIGIIIVDQSLNFFGL